MNFWEIKLQTQQLNEDKTVKQKPIEVIIIPPKKREERLNELKQAL